MRQAVAAIAVIALFGCGNAEEGELTVGQQQIIEETSCENLERGIETRNGYLEQQEADPDYGMTDEQVAAAEQSNQLAAERMNELDC